MITVAIPIYNSASFLERAIQSVFDQTYTDWKLILVDDGSNDNSLSIALKFKDDPRVVVYTDGLNKGLPFRLNQISDMVSTEYMARMDADDIMHPRRLEKQLEVLSSNPDIDVLGTNVFSIDENDLIQGVRYAYQHKDFLQKTNSFIHPTIVAKTQWFRDNPYDIHATRIEDIELWFRTSKNYNFQMLTEPLLFYRESGNHYYKKYFRAYSSIIYLLSKYSFNIELLLFALKHYTMGFIYFIFNMFDLEKILIKKRNEININAVEINKVINSSFIND